MYAAVKQQIAFQSEPSGNCGLTCKVFFLGTKPGVSFEIWASLQIREFRCNERGRQVTHNIDRERSLVPQQVAPRYRSFLTRKKPSHVVYNKKKKIERNDNIETAANRMGFFLDFIC